MSRPTHAMQQQEIDDAMAALPSKRLRWFFTPDPRWVNTVNTTSLRTINGVRMFVGFSIVFALTYLSVVVYALFRCDFRDYGVLGTDETLHEVRRLCEESAFTTKLLDFAHALFDGYGWTVLGVMGVAVVEMIGKRKTDTEHNVRVEEAKKAPIIVPGPVTSEHSAPNQQMTVNVGDDAVNGVQGGPKPATAERAAPEVKPKTEPDLYADDERGD